MSLRVRPHEPDSAGCVLDISPSSAGWDHVGFRVVKLSAGRTSAGFDADRETCLVLLSGSVDIRVDDRVFDGLVSRDSVFDDAPPVAVYVPAGRHYKVTALGPVELAICSAPGGINHEPRVIDPSRMSREVRGTGTNQRFVRNILPEIEEADSLLVVEVITPAGNWSSYPPHKHDTATTGQETVLEETYYHRLNPPQGFAFQRVYTDDRSIDETIAVEDGDVVMVPGGYHPVGAAHGYDLYYLNVMAGPKREWIFRNDPAHAWIATKS